MLSQQMPRQLREFKALRQLVPRYYFHVLKTNRQLLPRHHLHVLKIPQQQGATSSLFSHTKNHVTIVTCHLHVMKIPRQRVPRNLRKFRMSRQLVPRQPSPRRPKLVNPGMMTPVHLRKNNALTPGHMREVDC